MGVFTPAKGAKFRYSLQKGMAGFDVAALQLNLNNPKILGANLPLDGIYGDTTEAAVKQFQALYTDLPDDGIAGYFTQRKMASKLAGLTRKDHNLPSGLLAGLIEGESGWYVGAVGWNKDQTGTIISADVGWLQRHVALPGTDDYYKNGFSGAFMFDITGRELRLTKDKFYGKPGAKTHKRAWELAILNHNWPAGATTLANGGTLSTEPADWVIRIGVPKVSTPAQWAAYYIRTKTLYVKEWIA